MAEPETAPDGEAVALGKALEKWEREADALLADAGGDARSAIIALLVRAAMLEDELDETRMVVSSGFTRGWHRRRIGQRLQ